MASSGRPILNRFSFGAVTLAVILAGVVIAVSALRAADAGPAAPDQADPLPVAVQTVRFEHGTDIETRFPALIAARRESALGFEAGGRIAEIGYDVGDRVEAGAVLASLDTRTLEAQLASARSQIAAAEARADLAGVTLNRQRQLVEQGHVSPQRLDEAAADARSARAQAEAARAEAQSLQVRIELSRLEAPFSGVVTGRFADEGVIAGPGAPVLQLVEDGALELRAGLPERDARALEPGETYAVEIDGREIEVLFRATTGVIDSRRRSVTAVFDLDPQTRARSGRWPAWSCRRGLRIAASGRRSRRCRKAGAACGRSTPWCARTAISFWSPGRWRSSTPKANRSSCPALWRAEPRSCRRA